MTRRNIAGMIRRFGI